MRRKDSAMDVRSVSPSQGQNGVRSRDSLGLTVLGVCTGTGLGYLECALVRFDQTSPSTPLRVKLQQFDRIAVPASIKEPLVCYLSGSRLGSPSAPQLDELLGLLFSGGIKSFCRKNNLNLASIDLVGTHSEALRHLAAQANVDGAKEHPLHWNSLIALETGISTVFDYTIVERAVVRPHIHPTSYVDRVLLRHPTKFRVCLNIDEITNLSFIPPHGNDGVRATISRDCGPGSLLIDYAMRYCTSNDKTEDNNGSLGGTGRIHQDIIDQFLETRDYLRQMPPMSIATEMFGDHEAQQLVDECLYRNLSEADTIATITRATAQNILTQYTRLLAHFFPGGQAVDELFICGPSAQNANIIDYLEAELPQSVITKPLHDIGIPSAAHEAVCYAHLALEAVLSQATQAAEPPLAHSWAAYANANADAVRARVVPGRRWSELLTRLLGFSGGHKIHGPTDVRIEGSLEAAVQGMDIR
ncbi:upf0075 domain protein [Stagonosporopsis vannaccii]|nr:upf0075 domain protein [Stagonosporopsis vannaccii]